MSLFDLASFFFLRRNVQRHTSSLNPGKLQAGSDHDLNTSVFFFRAVVCFAVIIRVASDQENEHMFSGEPSYNLIQEPKQ